MTGEVLFNIDVLNNVYSIWTQNRLGLGNRANIALSPPDNGTGRCFIDIRNKLTATAGNTYYIYNANELNLTAPGNYATYGIYNIIDQTGDFANANLVIGCFNGVRADGASQIATVRGTHTSLYAYDTSLITTATGLHVASTANGTITTLYGAIIKNDLGTGTITNYVGLAIEDLDRLSTKASHIIIGTSTVPNNRWALYNISARNNLVAGPVINYAMSKEDDFDGTITWAAALAAGIKWRYTLGGAGAITQVSPALGGIINLFTNNTVATWLDENAVLAWNLSMYPALYARAKSVETADTKKFIGWADVVPGGAAGLPWTNSAVGVLVDTAVGNFFYLVGVVGGAVTPVSSTVALDANFHVFMVLPKYTTAGAFDGYELWVDGVYKCALTTGQCPATGTNMQCVPAWATNLGAAVSSNLKVDAVKYSQRRNTGTGDT